MKKSAILFGINDYHDCPLKNAANDASALSEKLTGLGFETKSRLYVSILVKLIFHIIFLQLFVKLDT